MMHNDSTLTVDDYLDGADVHEEHYQPITGAPLAMIFCILLAIGHGFNIYLLFWQGTTPLMNLVIHIILVAIAGFLVSLMGRADLDTRFARLAFVSTSVMSVLGAVGTLLALVQSIFYLRFRSSFEEWYQAIFPTRNLSNSEFIAEEIELGRDEHPIDYAVMSFMDVIEIGNEKQKRDALSKMTASFHPTFAKSFKRALMDDSSAIRVQAATAIARIENRFHERLLKIESLHREQPKNQVILKALADHYDDYAYTGLLDEGREMINREKAYGLYMDYLNMRPEDGSVRPKVGRLLIRMNRHEDAAKWFKRCLDEGYGTDSIKMWYIESLYHIGDFEGLRRAATSYQVDLNHYQETQPEIADSIYLWSQAGLSEKQAKAAG
ncbi:MAG: hypothetical protein P8P30_06240 [Rickettsiales bacterium]|nr:hypothetical protein [Rickettsiales bacterium]